MQSCPGEGEADEEIELATPGPDDGLDGVHFGLRVEADQRAPQAQAPPSGICVLQHRHGTNQLVAPAR